MNDLIDKSSFATLSKKIDLDNSKRVSYMQIVIESKDCGKVTGTSETPVFYITDIMLQGGTIATEWSGHVSEIRFSFDTA